MAPVTRDDISTMRPDCTNARIQIQWLEAQIANGFDPNRSEYERRYVAQAKDLIWEIRENCWQRVRH